VIEKGAKDALDTPSLTLMTMFDVVPVEPDGGVPLRAPLCRSNDAHEGLLLMEYVSVSPLASSAVGTNRYAVPASTVFVGAPDIVGGELVVAAVTTMLKGANETVLLPSVTEMTMLANVPTFDISGMPSRTPVPVSKLAHAGRLRIVNVRVSPSASAATGANV
jgi:hypothetical protein